MDVDSDQATVASNVDEWLARFSPVAGSKPGAFPFTSRNIQSIESRRASMSDLLIFDVLLIRGGIRTPDILFPPADWRALGKLLQAIDESVYDVLKKDCLVYILLKWAWDTDPKDTNPGWDVRYLEDRCIAPQFAALADAYWLLDTGIYPAKAVAILSDARLNRDYVSKILQALALSSSGGITPSTAALVVKYVRTAKPLLTEPDDIDLYALSLAHLSFVDAWTYQKSFPEGSDTRERLLRKIVGWCLMPTPKDEPLVQLLALPLSAYEQSFLHALALPSHFSTSLSLSGVNTTLSVPGLSPQAASILQDLLCVRAIQSGDYVHAIKLDRQFSSVSLLLASSASTSNMVSQTSSGRDAIDRKSIIQDIFATLPPAERTLLEDEIGKVATGVRPNVPSPLTAKHGTFAKRPLMTDLSLSTSWEDVGGGMGSPTPARSVSASSSAIGPGFSGKATPVPGSTASRMNELSASPFNSHIPRPQPTFIHHAPPTPKFTAFGSPIPPTTGVSTSRGVITERGKTLFSVSATSGPSAAVKPATHVSLFETAGSAKTAQNAFYKPPSALGAKTPLDTGSVLASSSAGQGINATKQNRKPQGEGSDEDVSMGSRSDVEIIEDEHHEESGAEEQDEDAGNFITYDKSGAADLTLRVHRADEVMDEDQEHQQELGFSVFSRRRPVAPGGEPKENGQSRNEHASHVHSPPHPPVSPPRRGDKQLSTSMGTPPTNRPRAPPGAFHHEEEDDEDEHVRVENEDEDDNEDDRVSLTTPVNSPPRNTRTRMQTETPSRPSSRSQPRRSSKTPATTAGIMRPSTRTGGTSSRSKPNQPIPGALLDEDDVHGQDDTDHTDVHGDEDTEIDEQEEEEDAIAPLPSRSSRRTRSAGNVSVPTTASTKSKPSAKATAPTRAAVTGTKGKGKARPSEAKTPPRRSSRLSTASSISPDHNETASPTKRGRKSMGSKAPTAGSGAGTAATRTSGRRKR